MTEINEENVVDVANEIANQAFANSSTQVDLPPAGSNLRKEEWAIQRRLKARSEGKPDSELSETEIKRIETIQKLEMISFLPIQEGEYKMVQTRDLEIQNEILLGNKQGFFTKRDIFETDSQLESICYLPEDDEWEQITKVLIEVPSIKEKQFAKSYNKFLENLYFFCKQLREKNFDIDKMREEGPLANNSVVDVNISTHSILLQYFADANYQSGLHKLFTSMLEFPKRELNEEQRQKLLLDPNFILNESMQTAGLSSAWKCVNSFMNATTEPIDNPPEKPASV